MWSLMKVQKRCGGRRNIERGGDVAIPSSVGRRCGNPRRCGVFDQSLIIMT